MQNPVFSIITVVYNGSKLLPPTIESVLNQTAHNYEYLLIDGASKDDSVRVIEQYAAQSPRMRYISEPDKGLYDAMNKGLRLANGTYVWFLNAGDALAGPSILAEMERLLEHQRVDVFYGDTILIDDQRRPLGLMSQLTTRSLPGSLHARHYLYGMRVVHQSFVPRRRLCPAYRTDNLCADFDWCIEILKKANHPVRVPTEALSLYLAGGISKKRHRQSLQDRFAVMRKHFGLLPTLWAHGVILLRAGWHRIRRAGQIRY